MVSYLQLPDVATVDPYTQRPRTRFTRRLLSPGRNIINTMPPEVLAEIFLRLLEDDDMDLHHSIRPLVSPACHSDPLLFGQVCSYWRNVALDTPKLWSRIYILKPQKSQVRLAQLWLERARGHPLDLSIWEAGAAQCDESVTRDIVSLFSGRRQYWKNISFTIQVQTLKVFARIIQSESSLDLLESATLWVSRQGASDRVSESDNILDDVWKTIHSCKSLRYVDWRSAYGARLPEHCPWNQLTGLTLSSTLTFDQLLSILSVTSQLVFLRAHSLTSSTSDTSEIIPHNLCAITHPRLRTLHITSNQETGPLFRLLSLPALQVLKIRHNFQQDVPRDVIGFQEFLERSKSKYLTNFELEDIFINEGDMRKYLESPGFRNLLHIKLFTKMSDEIVRQLANIDQEGRHEVLPSLNVMNIGSDWLQTRDGALSNMIASRFSPINKTGSLKKIGLLTVNLGPIDRSAFSNMFRQGLEGTIKTGCV